MNDAQRWARVLEAHADEHAAMAERRTPHITRYGRERGIGRVNLPPYRGLGGCDCRLAGCDCGLRGLGGLTEAQKTNAIGATVVIALALGALWYAKG